MANIFRRMLIFKLRVLHKVKHLTDPFYMT